jgi:Ca-activated chloride channel homolog
MDLLWPAALYLLILIPLIIAAYIWILRRRRRFAVRYSSLSLVRDALGRQSHLRRHIPFALFMLAMASLIMALARPRATVDVPGGQTTVILALDVSRSMCQRDIAPNRLEAAKAAALSFIQNQESTTQIGIVAFAGFAELIVAPTNDQIALTTAVETLTTARRTAIGSAILKSLDAIAEIYEDVAPSGVDPLAGPIIRAEGDAAPYIIVLLTDGVNNAGPEPLTAAQEAVERGVPVYTIGFGTANASGPIPLCGPGFEIMDPLDFGGGIQQGGGLERGIDEVTLKQVAEMTGAVYFPATSSGELQEVFQKLPVHSITKREYMEISVLYTAIGALLAAFAMLLSWIWNPVH